ncbi:MAG: hypothetical protein ACOYL7_15525 [Caldilinea sp.]
MRPRYLLLAATVALATLMAMQTVFAQPPIGGGVFLPLVGSGGSATAVPTAVPIGSAERFFPGGLAVAAPFNVVRPPQAVAGAGATSFVPAYRAMAERIRAALLSTASVPITNAVRSLVQGVGGGRANCYGPQLDYTNHPGGGSGQLPGGDLGLWLEYEPQLWSDPNTSPSYTQTLGLGTADAYTLTYGSPGHACSVAQLNGLMRGIEAQSESALTLAAALVAQAAISGTAVLTNGTPVDLTAAMNSRSGFVFSQATLSRTEEAIYYVLVLSTNEQALTGGGSAAHTYGVTVTLAHEPESSAPTERYRGLLTYQILDSDYRGGLQCPSSGPPPRSAAPSGSLAYHRSSATDLKVQVRQATFCVSDAAAAFTPEGLALVGWSDNYNAFTANFDPSAAFTGTATVSGTLTTDLAGTYAFAWQAGTGDGYSRIFNVGVNDMSPMSGESYFGFGRPIQQSSGHSYVLTDTAGVLSTLRPDDAVLAAEGMFCNWAGPGTGGAVRFQPYAQRQFVQLNESSGFFEVPSGGSDIRYAPTDSCLYSATGYNNAVDFWYDRTLNRVRDEVYTDPLAESDNPFGDRGVASIAGAANDADGAFDLMDSVQATTDYGSIVNLLIHGRGYDLPEAP